LSSWLIVLGAVGVIAALTALLGTGLVLTDQRRWLLVIACVFSILVILILLLAGLEYSEHFWEGRS
jgi:TRAP-type C4-dicarboxylate transport system permease small subunit